MQHRVQIELLSIKDFLSFLIGYQKKKKIFYPMLQLQNQVKISFLESNLIYHISQLSTFGMQGTIATDYYSSNDM